MQGVIYDYFQLVTKVQLRSSCGQRVFPLLYTRIGAFKPLEIGTVKEKSSISDPCKSV